MITQTKKGKLFTFKNNFNDFQMKHSNVAISLIIGIFVFQSCSSDSEVVTLQNKVSGEKIFLRYYAWGETSVISINHFADVDTCYDIVIGNTGVFFYKFDNDSLVIHSYGIKMPPEENIKKKYKTKIIYWDMKNGNADFVDFARSFKNKGYKIFPPSLEYIVHN